MSQAGSRFAHDHAADFLQHDRERAALLQLTLHLLIQGDPFGRIELADDGEALRKRKPIPTVDGLGFQAAQAATASLQFQGRSSLSLEARCPRAS